MKYIGNRIQGYLMRYLFFIFVSLWVGRRFFPVYGHSKVNENGDVMWGYVSGWWKAERVSMLYVYTYVILNNHCSQFQNVFKPLLPHPHRKGRQWLMLQQSNSFSAPTSNHQGLFSQKEFNHCLSLISKVTTNGDRDRLCLISSNDQEQTKTKWTWRWPKSNLLFQPSLLAKSGQWVGVKLASLAHCINNCRLFQKLLFHNLKLKVILRNMAVNNQDHLTYKI